MHIHILGGTYISTIRLAIEQRNIETDLPVAGFPRKRKTVSSRAASFPPKRIEDTCERREKIEKCLEKEKRKENSALKQSFNPGRIRKDRLSSVADVFPFPEKSQWRRTSRGKIHIFH